MVSAEVVGFEQMKELYAKDEDFSEVWEMCNSQGSCNDYHVHKGYLMKGNQLCIPRSSLRKS